MEHVLLTIEEIIVLSKTKTLACFGAGQYLRDIISDPYYSSLNLFQSAQYILDNNKSLDRTYFEYKDMKKKIYSVDKLATEDECYIIITAFNNQDDIINQLSKVDCKGGYIILKEVINYYRYSPYITKILEDNKQKEHKIPKIIHYCWFGSNSLPEKEKYCLESWKKYCSEYKLMFWNESNFDITANPYVYEAYSSKKYAFVSDYVRLWAIYNYGGIYMDTDVEVLKNLDCFLSHRFFSGFEDRFHIPTGIMGGEYHSEYVKFLLSYYDDRHFIVNGKMDITTNVEIITRMTEEKYKLTVRNGYIDKDVFTYYPQEVFCPIDYETKNKNITSNTHTIHWFSGSWVDNNAII